jgi:acetate kinase
MPGTLLTINGGSSSVKVALFGADSFNRHVAGKVDRVGPQATIQLKDSAGRKIADGQIAAADHAQAIAAILENLAKAMPLDQVAAVGHRVVHGGPRFANSQRIDAEMMAELKRISPWDPDHLPAEIQLIEALGVRLPHAPQIACFDTAFHHNLPTVAKLLPIPRRFFEAGVRRYGFHGISFTYLMEELGRVAGPQAAAGRVIIAHLGAGASMAAVKNGRPIDTSMSFTPTAGLVMATRTGDLDPGVLIYLRRTEGLSVDQIDELVNRQSGVLGVSETSADMRDLLARETTDQRAAEAISLFCYQAKKSIGAFAAALCGLDTLVFSAGIGENSAAVRSRICSGLEHLGLQLDESQNAAASPAVISADSSRVSVHVIPTDEELMIARDTRRIVNP